MSRIKADLERVSMNQLCILTGKTSRTLKKLLADVDPMEEGGTLYYIPRDVLPLIYAPPISLTSGSETHEILDPVREKARLDRLKGDKVQVEIKKLLGELISVAEVETSWQRILGNFRQKMLNLPAKLAPRVCATKEIRQIEKILREECHEALSELARYGDGIARDRTEPKSG